MLAAIPATPRDALAGVLGRAADEASDVAWVGTPDRKKNLLARFTRGADALVLKVYRDSPGHFRQTFANPFLAHLVGAYALRGRSRQRLRAESEAIEAFAAAGIPTLEIVERPSPDALVFRWIEARSLQRILETARSPDVVRSWIVRMAADLAARQDAALARRDRRLLHPHPRINHVLVDDRERMVHHDFEGLVNPALSLETALGLEVECFLSYLGAWPVTRDRALLEAAVGALGPEPIARWHAVRRKPLWFFSGSARNRKRRLGWLAES